MFNYNYRVFLLFVMAKATVAHLLYLYEFTLRFEI